MDGFDPYDDDHISGYLIDDLGDDDADFENDPDLDYLGDEPDYVDAWLFEQEWEESNNG